LSSFTIKLGFLKGKKPRNDDGIRKGDANLIILKDREVVVHMLQRNSLVETVIQCMKSVLVETRDPGNQSQRMCGRGEATVSFSSRIRAPLLSETLKKREIIEKASKQARA